MNKKYYTFSGMETIAVMVKDGKVSNLFFINDEDFGIILAVNRYEDNEMFFYFYLQIVFLIMKFNNRKGFEEILSDIKEKDPKVYKFGKDIFLKSMNLKKSKILK